MLTSMIGRLRLTGIIEGISWLVLLFIAMPLKYIWKQPEFVTHVGRIHGGLFTLFCFLLLFTWIKTRWSFKRVFLVFLSALLPFGFFFFDRIVREKEPQQI